MEAAKHRQLASVGKSIGNRPLEYPSKLKANRLAGGQGFIEFLKRHEKPSALFIPREWCGGMPLRLAMEHCQGPVKQITHMGYYLEGRIGSWTRLEIGE